MRPSRPNLSLVLPFPQWEKKLQACKPSWVKVRPPAHVRWMRLNGINSHAGYKLLRISTSWLKAKFCLLETKSRNCGTVCTPLKPLKNPALLLRKNKQRLTQKHACPSRCRVRQSEPKESMPGMSAAKLKPQKKCAIWRWSWAVENRLTRNSYKTVRRIQKKCAIWR